jgi:hypothetical protein
MGHSKISAMVLHERDKAQKIGIDPDGPARNVFLDSSVEILD